MEVEVKNAEVLSQTFSFEKRQLLSQINKLEDEIEQQKKKGTVAAEDKDIRRSFSLSLDPYEELQESLLDGGGTEDLVDLDALVGEVQKPKVKSPLNSLPDIANQIITEVAEEDKDSGFGDYGSSSDEEDDESEDTKSESSKKKGGAPPKQEELLFDVSTNQFLTHGVCSVDVLRPDHHLKNRCKVDDSRFQRASWYDY